jgi:hypothetical protein
LADRRRCLRRLTRAYPPHKLYTRTYTLRRPLFPARLAAEARDGFAKHLRHQHSTRSTTDGENCATLPGMRWAAAIAPQPVAMSSLPLLHLRRMRWRRAGHRVTVSVGIDFETSAKETRQWSGPGSVSQVSCSAKRAELGRRQEEAARAAGLRRVRPTPHQALHLPECFSRSPRFSLPRVPNLHSPAEPTQRADLYLVLVHLKTL